MWKSAHGPECAKFTPIDCHLRADHLKGSGDRQAERGVRYARQTIIRAPRLSKAAKPWLVPDASAFFVVPGTSKLGHPQAALADANGELSDAHKIGNAVTMMFALEHDSRSNVLIGDYRAAHALARELFLLADETGALFWKAGAWKFFIF